MRHNHKPQLSRCYVGGVMPSCRHSVEQHAVVSVGYSAAGEGVGNRSTSHESSHGAAQLLQPFLAKTRRRHDCSIRRQRCPYDATRQAALSRSCHACTGNIQCAPQARVTVGVARGVMSRAQLLPQERVHASERRQCGNHAHAAIDRYASPYVGYHQKQQKGVCVIMR